MADGCLVFGDKSRTFGHRSTNSVSAQLSRIGTTAGRLDTCDNRSPTPITALFTRKNYPKLIALLPLELVLFKTCAVIVSLFHHSVLMIINT